MNKSTFIALTMSAASLAGLSGCGGSADSHLIDKHEFTSESGIFDIEALEALGRVSGTQVTPELAQLLYGVIY